MTATGKAYGQALYDLAKEEKLIGKVREQLEILEACFREEPSYLRLLAAPNLKQSLRLELVQEAFSRRICPLLLNFMMLLTEKGLIGHFLDCCEAYRLRYQQEQRELEVTAVSAVPLSSGEMKELRKMLEEKTGRHILLKNSLEEGVLGGVRLQYGDVRVDHTVAKRFRDMGRYLGVKEKTEA